MRTICLSIFLFLIFFIQACTSTQESATTPNPKVPPEMTAASENLEPTLDGKWTMSLYSAFSPTQPEYQPGDVVYEFNDQSNVLLVTRKKSLPETTYSLPSGEYYYGTKDCLIQVEETLYFYSIQNVKDKDGSTAITLSLDTNTDPSISADGAVYILTKFE